MYIYVYVGNTTDNLIQILWRFFRTFVTLSRYVTSRDFMKIADITSSSWFITYNK